MCPIAGSVLDVEMTAQEAWLIEGDERNIKITTPQDLLLAEMLLAKRL